MTRLFFFSASLHEQLHGSHFVVTLHAFLKITLELVITFVPARDRKNVKITHPADSHWITRLSKPEARSRGFVFHLTRMDHPG